MKKQAGFTLIELLIVIFVISTGLLVIIQGLIESHKYISESAQRTIALNLAKEWIEAVYNLRNTNWRRYSDKKNECWLGNFPYSETLDCSQAQMTKWELYITTTENGLQKTSYISSLWRRTDQYGRFEDIRPLNDQFRLYSYSWQFLSSQDLSKFSPDEQAKIKANTQQGVYYRVISIHGVFDKETGIELNCNVTPNLCKSDTAKELRFCSTVFYTQPYQWVVNLCSILTNFERDEQ